MSFAQIEELNKNDRTIGLRLEQIAISARGGHREKNRAFTNPVTQEQIDEYRRKLSNPIIIDGERYKYVRPDETPDLEELNPDNLREVLTDEQIAEQWARFRELTANPDYENAPNELRILNRDLQLLREKIGNLRELRETQPDATVMGSLGEELTVDQAIQNTTQEATEIITEIRDLKTLITNTENEIEAIQHDLRLNDQNIKENQAEISRVSRDNKLKLEAFRGRLNELNRGAFNVEQQPNETDEEYKARLEEMAATPYDDDALIMEANLYNIKKLKDNLKSITRNASDIENVVKSFSNQDIFQINKVWPIIRKKYIDLYGKDSINVRWDDIAAFIAKLLDYSKTGTDKKDIDEGRTTENEINEIPINEEKLQESSETIARPEIIGLQESAPLVTIHEKDGMTTYILNYQLYNYDEILKVIFKIKDERLGTILREKILYFRVARKEPLPGHMDNPPNVLVSQTGEPGTFRAMTGLKNVKDPNISTEEIFKQLGISEGSGRTNIRKIFGDSNNNVDIAEALMNRTSLKETIIKPTLVEYKPEKRTGKYSDVPLKLLGLGVPPPEDIPSGFIPFGRIKINLNKLYYKNLLAVRHGNGSNIPGFNTCHVSDNFVNIIMKMMKKNNIKKSDIDSLPHMENELFNTLIYAAGLSKDTYNSGDNHINELKKRLELIEGEISAGNNNDELLKELYNVLMKLVSFNVIGINQARTHYKDIKKNYFS